MGRVHGRLKAERAVALATLAGLALLGSCLARDEGQFQKPTDDDAGTPGPIFIDGSSGDAKGDLPPSDPHAVLGVDPPHGPWNGGQTVMVRGNGMNSEVRVWFGSSEIPASDLVPVDTERVQVVVPPGTAGPVDVSVQNGQDESTRRSLTGGYEYDQFYADPPSGPTSGGTVVTLHGQGTKWNDKTQAFVDLVPCAATTVVSATELWCTTPPSSPGTKPIRVTTDDGVNVDVLDAFTFGNSDNGFKGGLSGKPLKGELRVIALDGYTGLELPTASVVVGQNLSAAAVKQTDGSGVAVFQNPNLGPKQSVTVVKKCYQPITFVDVPVDTVTVYLDPIMSPQCAEDGDPPPVGGTPSLYAAISGQLVWKSKKEFQTKGSWSNVPTPKGPDEKLVAYVFELAYGPTYDFWLPSSAEAVTPNAPGVIGYSFSKSTGSGNLGLYALAGIENRNADPPYFKAYAMGIAKGVATSPGKLTSDVYIAMDIPLDHALEMLLTGPKLTPKGPDRVEATVAVRVGELGYAILPAGRQERLLPVSDPIKFVGVPPLVSGLAGSQYVYTASAVTGSAGVSPRSVAALYATTVTSAPVTVDPFVEIPKLSTPDTSGSWSGTDLSWSSAAGGQSVELSVIVLQSGAGLVNWLVAAPTGVTSTELPDIKQLSPEFGLLPGPITIGVTLAHIEDFDYGNLRYRQLDTRGWTSYASDVFYSHL